MIHSLRIMGLARGWILNIIQSLLRLELSWVLLRIRHVYTQSIFLFSSRRVIVHNWLIFNDHILCQLFKIIISDKYFGRLISFLLRALIDRCIYAKYILLLLLQDLHVDVLWRMLLEPLNISIWLIKGFCFNGCIYQQVIVFSIKIRFMISNAWFWINYI